MAPPARLDRLNSSTAVNAPGDAHRAHLVALAQRARAHLPRPRPAVDDAGHHVIAPLARAPQQQRHGLAAGRPRLAADHRAPTAAERSRPADAPVLRAVRGTRVPEPASLDRRRPVRRRRHRRRHRTRLEDEPVWGRGRCPATGRRLRRRGPPAARGDEAGAGPTRSSASGCIRSPRRFSAACAAAGLEGRRTPHKRARRPRRRARCARGHHPRRATRRRMEESWHGRALRGPASTPARAPWAGSCADPPVANRTADQRDSRDGVVAAKYGGPPGLAHPPPNRHAVTKGNRGR